jgi:hypothetical protein
MTTAFFFSSCPIPLVLIMKIGQVSRAHGAKVKAGLVKLLGSNLKVFAC